MFGVRRLNKFSPSTTKWSEIASRFKWSKVRELDIRVVRVAEQRSGKRQLSE